MTGTQIDLASAISGYARIFHEAVGAGQHVLSPLGAWLLLALGAPAAGPGGAALTQVLGCDAAPAAAAAGSLLAAPHPLVSAAAGVWTRPGVGDARWLAGLPPAVAHGDIPGQDALDRWAREHTLGLIERFPVLVDAMTSLVLATAVATRVSWDQPFDLAPGSALGPASPWARGLARVLRTPARPGGGHQAFIAVTPEAGDVAVHAGHARGGLLVVSVAADPGVPPAEVLAAAHRIAIARATGRPVPVRSLFDLPLGAGPLWYIRQDTLPAGPVERCDAVLPAWSAQTNVELSDPRLGFGALAAGLAAGGSWRARQAAMARYSRVGFEAAAVTAFAVAVARLASPARSRVAELRFGHPFAVVAVAIDEDGAVPGPWHGVPVFSAWVTDPENADAD
jgi:hypothetical protein